MKTFYSLIFIFCTGSFLTSACRLIPEQDSTPGLYPQTLAPLPQPTPTVESSPSPVDLSIPTPEPLVPDFAHIVIMIFENKEYDLIVGNGQMAYFNLLANSYTLLNQHYAVSHPSLPNYLSLIGGDTFGIEDDCDREDCYINVPSLPDLIEQSGRTWKTYQEEMPDPCYLGTTVRYVRKHNPFVFFEPIRTDQTRCEQSIVPLTHLDADLITNDLADFIFITPNICHSAHDCPLGYADQFIKEQLEKLYPVLEATGEPYLIILTWDEGNTEETCCGLTDPGGGHVATVLISPQVKQNYQDATPYSHYSILKTIADAWGLPYLGHAGDAETSSIVSPWK